MQARQARPANRSIEVAEYLDDPAVQARMLEYCGATEGGPPTAAFVCGMDITTAGPVGTWNEAPHVPLSELPALWERQSDVSRSLWDAASLTFLFEIDYQNLDQPAEPFLHPAEVFFKLEPVYRTLKRVFAGWGLRPAVVITGRGYQFTGQVSLSDPVIDELAALAPGVPAWFERVEVRRPPGVTAPLDERQARAYMGLGLLLEHIAHVTLARVAERSQIPVVVNGTVVGDGLTGRECASLDFSHAGDPLDARHARIAFSPYQWHRMRPDIFGDAVASRLPPLCALFRTRASLEDTLREGRTLDAGIRAARQGSARLPNVAAGVSALIASYRRSSLAAFHREFHAEKALRLPEPRLPGGLPACMTTTLERPNDLLLKPEHVQHVVRGLLARQWTAAQIASLVRRLYEEDHGWGDRWIRTDAESRADFDVRVFAGLVATGIDGLVDFNCVSAQEKNLCPRGICGHDLRRDRDLLLARRPS